MLLLLIILLFPFFVFISSSSASSFFRFFFFSQRLPSLVTLWILTDGVTISRRFQTDSKCGHSAIRNDVVDVIHRGSLFGYLIAVDMIHRGSLVT